MMLSTVTMPASENVGMIRSGPDFVLYGYHRCLSQPPGPLTHRSQFTTTRSRLREEESGMDQYNMNFPTHKECLALRLGR